MPSTLRSAAPAPRPLRALRALPAVAAAALSLGAAPAAQAVDFGPFTLTGFIKAEAVRGSNQCPDCQRFPDENRQREWADELVVGTPYGTKTNVVTLAQPFLAARFDLPQGFKLRGLVSQRWRDGKVDIPGWWYEKNVAVEREDLGALRIGAMTTRAWSIADYPFGSDIGLSDPWASSGAGYGLLGGAIRYTAPTLDVADGDLVLEVTYDDGPSGWKVNKPRFLEVWARYVRRDWKVDLIVQDTRNGMPVAWGHAPFAGISPYASDDGKFGGSGQSIVSLMGTLQWNAQWSFQGGLRANRWSGAYAVITQPGPPALWNNMFNVDWGGTLDGVANPGYAARSVDMVAGAKWREGPWSAHVGLTHLGKASTDNPSERGQSNSATLGAAGLSRDLGQGLQVYGLAGIVRYGKKGLAPLSMPSHSAFSNVDSRVARSGNWIGLGAVYTH